MTTPRILIVEDEGLTAIELKNKLKNRGYKVPSMASSGEEAIQKAIALKPDLILMDIILNGKINGIEAAKEIKKTLDIPIIYITAFGDEKTLQSAKITEPYAYILKPFDEKEVRYAIEIALYKHKMELKLKEKEKKFRLLYYNAPIAYQILNEEGYITEINQTWLDTLGYSRKDVISQYFGNFLASTDYHKFKENWNHYKDIGRQKTEFTMLCKDGSNLTVEFEIRNIYDEDNDSKRTLCTFYNISHHKNKHHKIKESLIHKEMLLEEINSHLQNNYNKIFKLINLEHTENIKENIEFKEEINQNKLNNDDLEIFQDDFAFVDFAQYVESLVEDLTGSYNLNHALDINLNIENIMLDLNTSLSYGLIINELLKSSINNIHFNENVCSINIDFHLDNNKFILIINDNYNNYPELMEAKNSSSKLVSTLVKQQHGTIGFNENKKSEIKVIFGIRS